MQLSMFWHMTWQTTGRLAHCSGTGLAHTSIDNLRTAVLQLKVFGEQLIHFCRLEGCRGRAVGSLSSSHAADSAAPLGTRGSVMHLE